MKKIFIKLIVFGILSLILSGCSNVNQIISEEEIILTGIVNNLENPLSQAKVEIPGTIFSTITDSEGKYLLRVPAGTNFIQVSKNGFQTASIPLTEIGVLGVKIHTIDFSMLKEIPENQVQIILLGNWNNNQMECELHIHNPSDESIEITFPNSQIFDFEIHNPELNKKIKWSSGKMFLSTLTKISLQPGETIEYKENIDISSLISPLPAFLILSGELAQSNITDTAVIYP